MRNFNKQFINQYNDEQIRTIFLTLCISITSVHAKQIKLLTIGNSFSEDAIEYYLAGLAEANGDTIIIGNMYIGGCSLEKHYINSVNNFPNYSYRKIVNGIKTTTPGYRLIDAISDEEWDYISFQQVSSLSGQYESYCPYLEQLISFVEKHSSNPDMEIVLHATWAYAQTSTHAGFPITATIRSRCTMQLLMPLAVQHKNGNQDYYPCRHSHTKRKDKQSGRYFLQGWVSFGY